MSARLSVVRSKNSIRYYVVDDCKNEQGKRSTRIVESLDSFKYWSEQLDTDSEEEVKAYLKQYVKDQYRDKEKEKFRTITIPLNPTRIIEKNWNPVLDCSILYATPVFNSLGLEEVCEQLETEAISKETLHDVLAALCAASMTGLSLEKFLEENNGFLRFESCSVSEIEQIIELIRKNYGQVAGILDEHYEKLTGEPAFQRGFWDPWFGPLVFRISFLARYALEALLKKRYSADQIEECLSDLKMTKVQDIGCTPRFTRTRLLDDLSELCGVNLAYEFILKEQLEEMTQNQKTKRLAV